MVNNTTQNRIDPESLAMTPFLFFSNKSGWTYQHSFIPRFKKTNLISGIPNLRKKNSVFDGLSYQEDEIVLKNISFPAVMS